MSTSVSNSRSPLAFRGSSFFYRTSVIVCNNHPETRNNPFKEKPRCKCKSKRFYTYLLKKRLQPVRQIQHTSVLHNTTCHYYNHIQHYPMHSTADQYSSIHNSVLHSFLWAVVLWFQSASSMSHHLFINATKGIFMQSFNCVRTRRQISERLHCVFHACLRIFYLALKPHCSVTSCSGSGWTFGC